MPMLQLFPSRATLSFRNALDGEFLSLDIAPFSPLTSRFPTTEPNRGHQVVP